jgi:branched-chain amino acid transport system permease protein
MDWGFIFERSISTMFGIEVLVFAMAAVGLNVQFGYAGLLNFGQVGFMAVGAYGLGVSINYFAWNFWVGVLFGVIYAIVLALILGVPTLRLRADYLAIVTIAASETIRLFVRWRQMKEVTGASEGIGEFADPFYDIPLNPYNTGLRYDIGPLSYLGRDLWVLTVGWVLLILIVLFVKRLMSSPWGRALKAIREDEDAARALGKNAYMYKLQALMLGGVIGAMAGMLQVIQKGSIQPDTFNPVITFTIWAILILGGPGRTWSPIIGAMIYWTLISFLENVLRQLPDGPADALEDSIGLSDFNISQVRFILVGLGLLLLARYRPQGIFGSREEMALDDR